MLFVSLLLLTMQPFESGEHIPVGAPEERGPLATLAVESHPIGLAQLSGAAEPDLFVATGRFGSETGLFLYPFLGRDAAQTPIFGAPETIEFSRKLKRRWRRYPPKGIVHEQKGGSVLGLWLDAKSVVLSTLDKERLCFEETRVIHLKGLPQSPESLGLLEQEDGTMELIFGLRNKVSYSNWKGSTRDPAYRPYDGAGVWQGGFPYVGLYAASLPKGLAGDPDTARLISQSDHELRHQASQICTLRLPPKGKTALLTGSRYGGLHYFHQPQGASAYSRLTAVDTQGITLRHPTIGCYPLSYSNTDKQRTDLIAGGEGGLYYYRFLGRFTEAGKPIYADPTPVLEKGAALFTGTLAVPNVVDWDGDDALDLIVGNSEGRVLWIRNTTTQFPPAFAPGIPVEADGHPIFIQPGYRDNIQGPGEARWGYTCPTVADWNEDGLPDLLMSDSTAKHYVYLNRGARTAPKLDRAHPLYDDGLELHGTFRVKPAVGKIDGRMAYITLDDADEFHLYWKVDDYNVTSGGTLRLKNGDPIVANFLKSGGTGRLKLSLIDWNKDGRQDLLVGTPRHGSVPHPDTGLPQSLGLPGAAVLVLINTGEAGAPRFAWPKLVAFKGQPIFLGQHACSPALAPFFPEKDEDLIVGTEDGRLRYYRREDLSLVAGT